MEPVRCAQPTIKSKSVNQKIWHRSVNCRSCARQAHQLLCLPSHCWAGVKCEVQFSPRLFRCFGFHSVSKSFHPNSCCGWMCSRRLVTLTHTQGDPCVWQPWTLIKHVRFCATPTNPCCQEGLWPWPLLLPEATFCFINCWDSLLKPLLTGAINREGGKLKCSTEHSLWERTQTEPHTLCSSTLGLSVSTFKVIKLR